MINMSTTLTRHTRQSSRLNPPIMGVNQRNSTKSNNGINKKLLNRKKKIQMVDKENVPVIKVKENKILLNTKVAGTTILNASETSNKTQNILSNKSNLPSPTDEITQKDLVLNYFPLKSNSQNISHQSNESIEELAKKKLRVRKQSLPMQNETPLNVPTCSNEVTNSNSIKSPLSSNSENKGSDVIKNQSPIFKRLLPYNNEERSKRWKGLPTRKKSDCTEESSPIISLRSTRRTCKTNNSFTKGISKSEKSIDTAKLHSTNSDIKRDNDYQKETSLRLNQRITRKANNNAIAATQRYTDKTRTAKVLRSDYKTQKNKINSTSIDKTRKAENASTSVSKTRKAEIASTNVSKTRKAEIASTNVSKTKPAKVTSRSVSKTKSVGIASLPASTSKTSKAGIASTPVSKIKLAEISSISVIKKRQSRSMNNNMNDNAKQDDEITSTTMGESLLSNSGPKGNSKKLVKRRSNKISNNNDLSETMKENYKPKLPIWRKETETPKLKKMSHASQIKSETGRRLSKRISMNSNQGVYEFPIDITSPTKKIDVKKRKPKRADRVKKPRKKYAVGSVLKNTYMTTDPSWQDNYSGIIPVNKFYSKERKPNEVIENSRISTLSCTDNFYDTNTFDMDDEAYEASVSVNDTTNLGQTLPTLSGKSNSHLPMLDALTNKFSGHTSTPRNDDDSVVFRPQKLIEKPKTVKEDLKICFGFDESEEEEEPDLGFSPVYKAPQLSRLHYMSTYSTSDVGGDSDSQPTRWKVPLNLPIGSFHRKRNNRCKSIKTKMPETPILVCQEQDQPTTSNNICNRSILYDLDECDNEIASEDSHPKKDSTNSNIIDKTLKDKEPNLKLLTDSFPHVDDFLPETSFSKPPRKSYNRESLEIAKKKFQEALAGGCCSSTEASEDETELPNKKRRRKKAVQQIKSTKSSKAYGRAKNSSTKPNETKKSKKTLKKEETDKSVDAWASDINSHFSEIDDIDLVME